MNPLTTVAIPDGVDDAGVRRHLLEHFGLEIGGGLGPMKGNTWRIGLMGTASTRANVTACLGGLSSALRTHGFEPRGDALVAANAAYEGLASVS